MKNEYTEIVKRIKQLQSTLRSFSVEMVEINNSIEVLEDNVYMPGQGCIYAINTLNAELFNLKHKLEET